MQFRNFKMVGYVIYGRGAFNQLDQILETKRKDGLPMIFLVDHFFKDKELVKRVPAKGNDKIIFADVIYYKRFRKFRRKGRQNFGWWWGG